MDFGHDEFASHYWRYFPGSVYAHPGDELVFDQEWTGEPHTVTFGTIVDRALPRIERLEKKYADEELTPKQEREAMDEFEEASAGLPVYDSYLDLDNANAIEPCFLDHGTPPQGLRLDRTARRETGKACPQREQPAFDGTQAYYSSGFIAPEGSSGGTFRMSLADDIEPGTYRFYCVVHLPDMQGRLVVQDADEELPTNAETNKQAREEIEMLADPLRDAFADARAGRAEDPAGRPMKPPLAGYHSAGEYTVAIDEFVPKVWRTKVNEPVTWTITGAHTVSFDVPRYVSIFKADDDGTLTRNRLVDLAAGGSPKAPPVDFSSGPVEIDGGTWDGSGFISSGLLGSDPVARYTLRVSKPGRYRYACLVHPQMVGTLQVDRR